MIRALFCLVAVLALAACGADPRFDPQPQVDAARHVAGPPAYITLYTGINDRNGQGAHSALLINGSERILFDPAGTFEHPKAPIQHDIHFGMSDSVVAAFLDYHARDSATEQFHVIERTMTVSPEIADLIIARVRANGPVPKAHCAQSISAILRGVPGFESLPSTYYPIKLGDAFGELPGVSTRKVTEANDNIGQSNIVFVDRRGNPLN
jgi:hypothetical protein